MSTASERTAWAEGLGLSEDQVDALTAIADESDRRGGDIAPYLDPRDVCGEWPAALEEAGWDDLAERVRTLRDEE